MGKRIGRETGRGEGGGVGEDENREERERELCLKFTLLKLNKESHEIKVENSRERDLLFHQNVFSLLFDEKLSKKN